MKMMFAPVYEASLRQFRPAAFTVRYPAVNIHLREKSIAGPTERSRNGGLPPAQARREGPALFDEDDAYAGIWSFAAARLKCC